MRITLNAEQSLYVIEAGDGYSCLGFEVCHQWTRDIARELNRPDLEPTAVGSRKAYGEYQAALAAARAHAAATGSALTCHLTPQLIGLERQRVEVINRNLDVRSFVVGRSGGFIPVHLELASPRARWGSPVTGAPFCYVRPIRAQRSASQDGRGRHAGARHVGACQ